MKRTLIIQPTLPSYRVDLFERLTAQLERDGGALWVHYAERDYLGVKAAQALPQGVRRSIKRYYSGGLLRKTPLSYPALPMEALMWAEVLVIPGHLHELEVALSAVVAKLRGLRLIWWGSFPSEAPFKRRARLWAAGCCQGIATYMPSQRAGLPERLQARARSLNNGLKPLSDPPRRPKLSERPPGVAVIGRPSPKSKILSWLMTLSEWRGGPLHIHLIGTSEADLAPRSLQLPPEVEVHAHGYVEREEAMLSVLAQCRVSFYPGAVGLSLMEGVRAGLPTLLAAPPAPHMPEFELFIEGELGRHFSADEHPNSAKPRWPEALAALLDDHAWLDEAQARCLARGEAFSTKVMAERLYELICGGEAHG